MNINGPMSKGQVVALRKESVDRNTSIDNLTQGVFKSLSARRAWIEIRHKCAIFCIKVRSLSARRAWIEIIKKGRARRPGQVALRKESVDRNKRLGLLGWLRVLSLSARRAWIEIKSRRCVKRFHASLSARRAWIEIILPPVDTSSVKVVALRKESVDRNFSCWLLA